jgi:6-pyruvoyltetrahydropterin/6-carboxytetrahydropterin synthase
MTTTIRRWVETDTGHRVPNHASKCAHLHGHRYRFEAEVAGDLVTTSGASDEGMVVDFGDISRILNEHVHDVVDHAFLVHEEDEAGRAACAAMGDGHRTVVLPFPPTAEHLAAWCFHRVDAALRATYGDRLTLVAFHVRETPKSWATYRP